MSRAAAVLDRPTQTPPETWLIARQPTWAVYPCRCWLGKPCRTSGGNSAYWCPCAGRTDHLDLMPRHCCARRAHETTARHQSTLETT